jgi:hypothetical protein
MKHKLILFCATVFCLATAALAHPTMTLELYRKFWPTAETSVVKRITLNDAQKKAIKTQLGGEYPKGLNDVDTFIVSSKTDTLGVLCNLEVEGADIGVAVDKARKKIVKVHFYTVPKGMEAISTPAYLKQFVGKTSSSPFKAGKDFKPVKAHSQALGNTVKGVLLYLEKGW